VEPIATRTRLIRTAADAAELGTILGVWAHPDDEAYLSAALMALAVEAGSRVSCVTATKGEQGTDDPERWPPARLAPIRADEMAASLAALGVDEHHWLGYRDGGCATVDHRRAVELLVVVIDEVEPDTIVTFGPDGFTGHADHIAVGRWVMEARTLSSGRPTVLWPTAPRSWVERHRALHDLIPVFGDAGPPTTPDDQVTHLIDPPASVVDRKMAALRAQRSQTRPLIEAVGEATYRSWWATEAFVVAP
jgi:LmbE family N-acetylglucosaminyl deacetylase